MKSSYQFVRSRIYIFAIVLLLVLIVGCGKSDAVIKNANYEAHNEALKNFCENFFIENNFQYEQLSEVDIQNTSDEYLIYLDGALIYRTYNDYIIAITERKNLHESDALAEKNYSGELYYLFETDSMDVLKCTAMGDYAMLCTISTISDWESDPVVSAFEAYCLKK